MPRRVGSARLPVSQGLFLCPSAMSETSPPDSLDALPGKQGVVRSTARPRKRNAAFSGVKCAALFQGEVLEWRGVQPHNERSLLDLFVHDLRSLLTYTLFVHIQ